MQVTQRHGGKGGKKRTVYFGEDEYIVAAVGYYGKSKWCRNCVNQLGFLKMRQDENTQVVGPYGSGHGSLFIHPYEVMGFFGSAGKYLDSIGFLGA